MLTCFPNLVSFGTFLKSHFFVEIGNVTINKKKIKKISILIEVIVLAITCFVPERVYCWGSAPNNLTNTETQQWFPLFYKMYLKNSWLAVEELLLLIEA